MKVLKSKWMILVALVIGVVILAAFSFGRSETPQYFTSKAEVGDIHNEVEATGTINAVTTVQVGSQVSGTISKLYADFNSHVKAGQVLAQIDPSLFQGALLQAKADLANARANAAAAKAQLVKAQATAVQATADYKRNQGLAAEGIISAQQLDAAKAAADSDAAAVNAAQAGVVQADAQVQQKAAAVSVAQTNLAHTTITSPIDGVVVNRTIDVGQTVAASLQAPNLFQIAQDLTKMEVYTSTDESDVGMIRVGQPVTFKVDAFPKDSFRGTVSQIRLNPTTVQNVVTYNTVVTFDNPDMKLFPGMTAYVTIPVANALSVLMVPNGALRFTPSLPAAQLQSLLSENGIQANSGARKARTQQPSGDQAQQKPQPTGSTAILWKETADKKLVPVQVQTGITDHTYTQIAQLMRGELKAGDQLVIGAGGSSAPKTASVPGGMRMR
ncbi:MAG: efflux RND transporter periplasmic adaptor subunit [Terriglobales bacterium]